MRMSKLQKAYGLASRLSETSITPARERKYFRAIAHLIWEYCGDVTAEQSRLADAADRAAGVPYSPDCCACLRGRPHTFREHNEILSRQHAASVPWDESACMGSMD